MATCESMEECYDVVTIAAYLFCLGLQHHYGPIQHFILVVMFCAQCVCSSWACSWQMKGFLHKAVQSNSYLCSCDVYVWDASAGLALANSFCQQQPVRAGTMC